jgi:hypothetical protein
MTRKNKAGVEDQQGMEMAPSKSVKRRFYDERKKASSGMFWCFFIGLDRGPSHPSGRRCRS